MPSSQHLPANRPCRSIGSRARRCPYACRRCRFGEVVELGWREPRLAAEQDRSSCARL